MIRGQDCCVLAPPSIAIPRVEYRICKTRVVKQLLIPGHTLKSFFTSFHYFGSCFTITYLLTSGNVLRRDSESCLNTEISKLIVENSPLSIMNVFHLIAWTYGDAMTVIPSWCEFCRRLVMSLGEEAGTEVKLRWGDMTVAVAGWVGKHHQTEDKQKH